MKIYVGVSGSIAAYRSPDLVKDLVQKGHEVRVGLSRSAAELVSSRVLATISGNPVLGHDPFGPEHEGTDHISTARWADCILVYAATAQTLARLAHGMGDDFTSLQILAARCPIVLAPAMNPAMWENAAVQANCATLVTRGFNFVGPITGQVICGESGVGHLASHEAMIQAVESRGAVTARLQDLSGPLKGKRVLISAGPMRSPLDSVRFLQNRSSGKMGLEIAKAASRAGADVSVLLGPVDPSIQIQFGHFKTHRYESAQDYRSKLETLFPECDAFLSLSAVLDFELTPHDGKIEREALAKKSELEIPLKSVPDLVALMATQKKPHQKVIAFAAEAGTDQEIVERAGKKMLKKGVDAIVANPVRPGLGPEADQNELWVLRPNTQAVHLGPALKSSLAQPLLSTLFQ